ncbi:MAG: EexN family lipoprotein, partial [Cycloclasticus sp.]
MIKNIKKLALAATATLLLAACAETAKTADWYIQNTAEQAIKLTECQQRPETLKTPNCVAAAEAELVISKGTDAIKMYL